jgi:hypothetical protein
MVKGGVGNLKLRLAQYLHAETIAYPDVPTETLHSVVGSATVGCLLQALPGKEHEISALE